MLCFKRKPRSGCDTVWIGPDIRLVVYECTNGFCRIAIDAPPQVRILRGELAEAAELGKRAE